MKAVILAGGFGTRISEETSRRPKPMVEIGGKPIIWHIMKIYSTHGINDFIVCLGYKGYVIKEYFANYFLHMSDITMDLSNNQMQVHENHSEPWKVTLVDTGIQTMTGGRLNRIKKHIDEEEFCFTYGDGVADVNITELIKFHRKQGKKATLTAVNPPGRFGVLDVQKNLITNFKEKPNDEGSWISGGFFVLSKSIFDLIDGDESVWEQGPMEKLASDGELAAYVHHGFWQPMDTLRDKVSLEKLWETGNAPWKVW